MKEHTDLEKKLFDYILYLIHINNVHNVALNKLYQTFAELYNWSVDNMNKIGCADDYKDMLDSLNKEFEWNLKLNKDESND